MSYIDDSGQIHRGSGSSSSSGSSGNPNSGGGGDWEACLGWMVFLFISMLVSFGL